MRFNIIKSILKIFIPQIIKNKMYNFILENKLKKLDTKEVFQFIYEKKLWTPNQEKKKYDFYSGIGSYDSALTKQYLISLKRFLKSLKKKPSIVELGCGDFQVSKNITNYVKKYEGFDIYKKLISFNKNKFKRLKNVKFKVLDFTKKRTPGADVCIIRLVLQHLSNKMIFEFLKNIKNKYKYLIVTEHCPTENNFQANKDIISGPGIRFSKNSGVDLACPPFNMKYKKKILLCKTTSKKIEGCLKTTLYYL